MRTFLCLTSLILNIDFILALWVRYGHRGKSWGASGIDIPSFRAQRHKPNLIGDNCQIFKGNFKDQKYPKCNSCREYYDEHVQRKVWFPRCGKRSDDEYRFQIKNQEKRKAMNKCIQHLLGHNKSNCTYWIHETRKRCIDVVDPDVEMVLLQARVPQFQKLAKKCCYKTCYEYYLELLRDAVFLYGCGDVPKPQSSIIANNKLKKMMKYIRHDLENLNKKNYTAEECHEKLGKIMKKRRDE